MHAGGRLARNVWELRKRFGKEGMRKKERERKREGRRPNGFPRLSLNDGTILLLGILLDKTVSAG